VIYILYFLLIKILSLNNGSRNVLGGGRRWRSLSRQRDAADRQAGTPDEARIDELEKQLGERENAL
jgi:hypothetical protein